MALYHRTPPGDSSQAKYNASRKEEIPPILPPQPDNIAGSLTGNNKIQDVGKNLWEGEAFAEQRALKRQVGASPVPTPGSEFDEYGGMFAQPLAQRGEIKAANKQRRQDRRQRVKDIKAAGGPENYSADGYHVGEYDKKGRNIQYPEKRYSKKNPPTEGLSGADVMSMQFHGFSDLPDDTNNVRGKKIPLNQSEDIIKRRKGKKYTTGAGMDETDLEEGKFKSSRLGTYNNEYNTENVSNIQEDKKSQFMTSISDDESWDETPRSTSQNVDNYNYKGVRDTLRPTKGKHFKMGWGEVDRNPSGRKWKKENK